jgi:hypothetical protein
VVVGWNHPGLGSEMRDRALPLPAAYLPAVTNDNGRIPYRSSSCGIVTHTHTHSLSLSLILSVDEVVRLRMTKIDHSLMRRIGTRKIRMDEIAIGL